jgi:hypothetical protein
VVTSTLETQMATLLRTVAQTAQAMLSGPGADTQAMRQQITTWVEQIALLPLLPTVKEEQAEVGHPAEEADPSRRAEGPPPPKQRRRLKDGPSAASADEEPGFTSASSSVEVPEDSGPDMDAEQPPKDVQKGKQDKGTAGPGRVRPGRSRSPH